MHLFEPRWVDMIDTARQNHGGVVGLVYFGSDGDVLPVATLAEVVACGNLGAAGRMVTVRGAARGALRGLSPEVAALDQWGFALVEELAELLPEDLTPAPATDDGSPREAAAAGAAARSAVEAAAARLAALLEELDLSPPAAAAAAAPAPREGAEAEAVAPGGGAGGSEAPEGESADEGAPQLWTHERAPLDEDFAGLAVAGAWPERLAAVEGALEGVQLPVKGPARPDEMALGALAALYAALGAASLETRLKLFVGSERGLAERLRVLAEELRERQGMARARRALAGVFAGGPGGEAAGAPAEEGPGRPA